MQGYPFFVRNNAYLYFMEAINEDSQNYEPTKSELEILQVLWNSGPSTVRFVNDKLNEHKRGLQYTSTLKLMQVMLEKGMLTRDDSQMKHVYSAAIDENKTMDFLLDRFVKLMYNGSASKLMQQLLGNDKTTPEQLNEIKQLLKQIDKKNN
jgi:predicted transcriptional regulator